MRPASMSHCPRGPQNANCSGVRLNVTRLRGAGAELHALEAAQFERGPRDGRHRVAHVELHDFIGWQHRPCSRP